MISVLVISAGIGYFLSLPFASLLQGANYRCKTYFSRGKKPMICCLLYFVVSGGIASLVDLLCGGFLRGILALLLYLATGIFTILLHKRMKMRLIVTNRLVRLLVLSILVYAGAFVALHFAEFRSLWASTPALMPLVLAFAALLISPFEKWNNRRYIDRAKCLLRKTSALKIGVTGSYGKTGVKTFLDALLSLKYATLPTPANYNTPLGIAKTMQSSTGNEEILILEMGARRVGDIRELCEIVEPNCAVITGIAPQHLETFGSVENILREKGELARWIPPEGVVYYNLTDERVRKLYDEREGRKVGVGTEKADWLIKEVEMSAFGSSFALERGGEAVRFAFAAVGMAALVDFALACVVAMDLGVSVEAIAERAKKISSPPHRFEVVKKGEVTVIDDSYNINPVGAAAALDSLRFFEGKRNVVYTSGIVELGEASDIYNRNLGKEIAAVASVAVVCSGKYGDAVVEGMRESDRDIRIVRVADTAEASKVFGEILRKGDVLLIMSDLPRDYLL